MTTPPPVVSSPSFPEASGFFLRSPLYEFFQFTTADVNKVGQIVRYSGPLDAFCVGCERESIFYNSILAHGPRPHWEFAALATVKMYDANFACSRNHNHQMWFRSKVTVRHRNEEVIARIGKIGQWPTVADLHEPQVKQYRKLLRARYPDLTKAIGLYSHGVGIGSFVYLRRIFESLVDEAHAVAAAADADFPESEYQRARMDEKIQLLRDYLPSYLVQNRGLYVILSRGIHELAEEECLRYFDVVRTGIEYILDERLTQQERADKAKAATDAISRARGELAG